jgi:hypothetical protein
VNAKRLGARRDSAALGMKQALSPKLRRFFSDQSLLPYAE